MSSRGFVAAIFSLLLTQVTSQIIIKFLIPLEMDSPIMSVLSDALSLAERSLSNDDVKVDAVAIEVDRENDTYSFNQVCSEYSRGFSIILDMTWTGWDRLRTLAFEQGIIYIRGGASIAPYVQAVDNLLSLKNATDIALIFENEAELNQSLYYLIGNSIIRLVVIDEFTDKTVGKIRGIRPMPSYYAIYASTQAMDELFKTAIDGQLVTKDDVWILVFTDSNYHQFRYFSPTSGLNTSVTVMTMMPDVPCRLLGDCPNSNTNDVRIFSAYFKRLITILASTLSEMQKSGTSVAPKSGQCTNDLATAGDTNGTLKEFITNLKAKLVLNDSLEYVADDMMVTYNAEISIQILRNGKTEILGNWTTRDKITPAQGKEILPAKRYFRVGTAPAIPWTFMKRDEYGHPVKDKSGKIVWEGYCIDFLERLKEEMNFDYDLVVPEDEEFGSKLPNGKWSGVVGDLSRGETDFAIAALTMTSEREEVIDFVAPYFEQSGILIVMRKPVRETSLFRFMTVLRIEVWMSIVGALILTGVMIWILDKYSPYSARNNKELYPYPCREFTLKESFWFALTSFTPQGGGEAPKALSSRTLVAAYWLFVVLMLATFTANLAAFLTVERMQTPVQSLEQLARQSRINYTVQLNSSTHQYFQNMKKAEDKLYTVWKEITLNSSSDQVEYRVWDYPIKEQYGHILQAINQVGPVKTAEEGFQKVLQSESAEFAFIHDSSVIRYKETQDCNLTTVGEVFAEQPYAIAVQQGSHLQEEISRRILDLQKNRYFETLSSKYWNQSLKAQCKNSNDNEGITLESLGGVFIATLFGLALAMITLAGEVIYYKKRNANRQGIMKNKQKQEENDKIMIQKLASKLQLKPAPTVAFVNTGEFGPKPRVSHISVYPRNIPFKE